MSDESAFREAITQLQHQMMEDDTLAQLVLSVLAQETPEDLPDFLMEPWFPLDTKLGLPKYGVRFTLSATSAVGEFDRTTATFRCLEVLVPATRESERSLLRTGQPDLFFDASDALTALEVSREAKTAAAKRFSQIWRDFHMAVEPLGAQLDEMSNTFTTEARVYPMD